MGLFDGIKLDDEIENNQEEEAYFTLQDKKLEQEIRKLKINNENTLRNLVEKELVLSVLGEIGQSIQGNFIDQAKRKANLWANQLGIPSKEREIETLISKMVESGIAGMMADIKRLSDDGVWE